MRLGSGLRRSGISMHERNIWDDPDDAAIVRSIAHGNETVPTVVVGSVGLVNPSLRQVRAVVTDIAPHLLVG